jgi:hypothetical protein
MGDLYLRVPPIDIRRRTCQGCGQHKPTKGGSIRIGRGSSGGFFLCAECKARVTAGRHDASGKAAAKTQP